MLFRSNENTLLNLGLLISSLKFEKSTKSKEFSGVAIVPQSSLRNPLEGEPLGSPIVARRVVLLVLALIELLALARGSLF